MLPAFGPTDWLELSLGGQHGLSRAEPDGYASSGPLAQAKILLRAAAPGPLPGLAIGLGALAPAGHGDFAPLGWSGYGYLAATWALAEEEARLAHANFGGGWRDTGAGSARVVTLGGTDVGLPGPLRGLAELVRGDSLSGASDLAVQLGVRYVIGDDFTIDAAFGRGLAGDQRRPLWGTVGLRVVSDPLW